MNRPFVCALLLSIVFIAVNAQVTYQDVPFLQLEANKFLFSPSAGLADWTVLPIGQVTQAIRMPKYSHHFLLLTSTALFLFNPENQSLSKVDLGTADLPTVMSVQPGGNYVALAGKSRIWRCSVFSQTFSCHTTPYSFAQPISAIAIDTYMNIWIGSNSLFFLSPSASAPVVALSTSSPVTSIDYFSPTGTVAVGTADKLYRFETLPGRSTPSWRFYRVDGLIDDAINALAFDGSGTLWIGNNQVANSQSMNLTFSRYGGGAGGIPYGNITCIQSSKAHDSVWMGTRRGVMRYQTGKWRYFNGPRWLTDVAFGAGNSVISLSVGQVDGREAVLVVTGTGMSWFKFVPKTLKDKADYFQTLVVPYHDRFGLTSSSSLSTWGLMSSYVLQSSENDGLWTSVYLASQALRYAVTGDVAAKSEADRCFGGLQLLNKVTGIKGLFARSIKQAKEVPKQDQKDWVPSTTMPGWIWQRDTSSDEVTGHMLAYILYYRLVAQNQDEKLKAATLLTDCMKYVIENDYYLIDITGKRTTWGVWNPDYLNDNPDWFDQRGVNSLQIMSWISAARFVAADSGMATGIFDDAMQQLVAQHEYDINVLNTKIAIPTDDNYSDDELTFLPYWTYLMGNGSTLGNPFFTGIDRAFDIVKVGQSPLWTFIYAASTQAQLGPSGVQKKLSQQDLSRAINTLQNWPMSWINWPVDNTQRLDTIMSIYPNRNNRKELVTLLPWDERDFFRWNADPFEFQATGNGYDLNEPSAYLLPYWMGRYYNYISA